MVNLRRQKRKPLVSGVFVAFLLLGLLGKASAFSPVDEFLIVCGSSKNVTFLGHTYIPDSPSRSSFTLKTVGNVVSAATNSTPPSPIYQSARVFTAPSSYSFDIKKPGRHWVRLYFYPIPAQNLTSASITVTAESYVLLNNFSFKRYNRSSYLFKEYAINISSDTLTLTFIPSNSSIAFVNAIEVVSFPDELIPEKVPIVYPPGSFDGLSRFALETVYRLNMGGPLLTPQNDTLGRTWENDMKYLHINSSAVNMSVSPLSIRYPATVTQEVAPNWVYATAETMGEANVINENFNISWVFPVDPNFMYLVRVHFCDIVSESLNMLVFDLYINDNIALAEFDLSNQVGNLDVPYYRDFVSNASSGSGSGTLTVSVGPGQSDDNYNAIMNGLEIMKISNAARSLDGDSPVESLLGFPKKEEEKKKFVIIVCSVVGGLSALLVSGLCCFCLATRMSKHHEHGHQWLQLSLYGNSLTMTKMSTTSQKSGGATPSCISLAASSSLGRFFSFQEITDATNRFDEALLLGVGGFGRVYKGTLGDGTQVAVKRGNSRSEQGMAEFRTEIEMLSKLRHRHLVSLIGYCDERSEMILVYEYMANGPLRSHLYGTHLRPLPWKQRLEICIGAARGLHYLHTGAAQSVIHRDVKTTNILLDENFVAKVADFGLSKTGPAIDQTHVSTAVKGSFGYLDPEYFRRQQLTEKSDVYSFGVVLMEVLCTRPALNPVLPRDQVNIAEWAMTWQKKGMLGQIIDPNLKGKVGLASLKKYAETAEKCLAEHGVDRPSMGDVLWNLEYALQLEEASWALADPADSSTNHIPLSRFENSSGSIEAIASRHSAATTDDDVDEDAATTAVFSQLVNPRGR
ncbi:hypothetical protein DM860_008656 [Cuscuta australis]|uniref:Protein kinase domain-containing protein n=1 Tax=Cuscuta australis TaxID=267555 RepID=A0A328D963_9ASTE|nr:hypothetical protein DM860_008656 [Cuscuta australis]